jgi:hypothetical protein
MELFIKLQITTSNYSMKYRNYLCFLLFLLLLGWTVSAFATESVDANADASLSFENAEAWNIKIGNVIELPTVNISYSRPAFSHDSSRIVYAVRSDGHASLVVRSVKSFDVLKTIPLEDDVFGWGYIFQMSVAYSPDDKKVVLGPVSVGDKNLLFIDTDTRKIVGVKAGFNTASGNLIRWPEPNYITVNSYQGVNLETLETFTLSEEQNVVKLPQQKNFVMDCLPVANFGSVNGDAQFDLRVSSRGHPYMKVLQKGVWGVVWSPDLRYILNGFGSAYGNSPNLIELGLCSTPALDFDVKGLVQSLTPEQSQIIKNAFNAGKRIWLSVYDRKINPLTDKLIGPDEGNFRGQGFLTQIEPTFRFKYTFENHPAQTNNIVSSLQVDNGENWGTKVWGELVKVGEGDDSGFGAIQVQQQSEQAVPQAYTNDTVIAKGKGFEIKRSQLDVVMDAFRTRAAQMGQTVSPQELTKAALNSLIVNQVLLQMATDADKANCKKNAEAKINTFIARFGTQEKLGKQLKAAGMTIDEYRSKSIQDATQTAVLQRELGTGISLTGDEAKKYINNLVKEANANVEILDPNLK